MDKASENEVVLTVEVSFDRCTAPVKLTTDTVSFTNVIELLKHGDYVEISG